MSFPSAPGPAPMWGFGALGNLVAFGRDPIGYAGRLFRAYGDVACLVRAPISIVSPTGKAVVLVNGPALNREVLTQHDLFHAFALPGRLFPVGETSPRTRPITRTMTGLFHVNGDEHRRHRRMLMPAFHKARIDAYRDDMVALTEDLIGQWRAGETRDVLADMTRLTLRIATKTLFGEDAGERGVALAGMMTEWLVTMFSARMTVKLDLPFLPYRRWLDLTRLIDDETAAIVRDKRAHVARAGLGDDILSMLIATQDEDGSALTEDDLIGHAGVIFAAGHETSTNALAWTLFLLSQHPHIASDLVDELMSVLRGAPPSVDDLGKMPLLDAVVKESMRVLPPVPVHPRIVARDTELGGHFLPARTELFLSIYHMHHAPELFPAPEVFRPARWSTIKPTTFEYNPFSAGPRMCIGAAFATMEIKIALAILLQRFRVSLADKRVDRRVAITMAPRGGLRMQVHARGSAWRGAEGGVRGDVRELVRLP